MRSGIYIEGVTQCGATPDDCDTANDLASASYFKVHHVVQTPAEPDDYEFIGGESPSFTTMTAAREVAAQKAAETGLPSMLWLMQYLGPLDAYTGR